MKLEQIESKQSTGQVKARCPECDEKRSDRHDRSLSVNLDTGHYCCHYCGAKGILDEFKKTSHFTKEEKEYKLPPLNTTGLGQDQQAWFFSRGITISTLNRNQITQSLKGWVEFNYYEFGKLTNVKYRSIAEKRFIQHKGGKPILYGLADIIGEQTVIITEGEIDKLSIEEAGFKNCVSVPLGAPNANDKNVDAKLRCFEYATDYFANVTEIIIAVDNDANGHKLKDEIARRFGKHICKWVDFGQYKDANEVLVKEGKEHLKSLIVQAREFPIKSIVDLSDYVEDYLQLYRTGLPKACNAGMGSDFDNLYKVKEGYLTVVTGVPSHGKSVFIENIMLNLIRAYGWRFGIYTPEHYPFSIFFQRIARIWTGKHFFNTSLDRMTEEELVECCDYLRNFIYPMAEDSGKSLDEILEIYEQAVFKYGIKGLVIDPWTDLMHDMGGLSETKYISDSLAKIKRFNHKYDVHTWLIAHPTKMQKNEDGTFQVPTLYSISGSANWYNRADMGMTVYRNKDNSVEVFIQKVKQEGIYGTKGSKVFQYDVPSCRYLTELKEEEIPF